MAMKECPQITERTRWAWCMHCETVIDLRETRNNTDRALPVWAYKKCPRCGAGPADVMPWAWVRENNQQYPKTPQKGKYYPLYPEK